MSEINRIVDPKRQMTCHEVIKLVEEKFTSTNSAITPPEERDCDSCIHDGDCYETVLHCKGYSRAAQ